MTPTEIYDIVKDVPREAWPENIQYYEDCREWAHYHCGIVNVEFVTLLLEASMVRRLHKFGMFIVPVYLVPNKTDGRGYQLLGNDTKYERYWTPSGETLPGDSYIEVLAAACKEVGNA